ncbi:MAG: hypothetical protein HY532_09065 [Chloroflexi bacterium]|nr:hypothetical protein [Chloroflexota bacterium]
MITITSAAKAELKRIRESRSVAPGKCLRLVTPPQWTGEGEFGIGVDDEREDDYVVEHQGVKVLHLDVDLQQRLERAVFDFKQTPAGPGFTLDIF